MADQRITQLGALTVQPASNDLFVVVDVSDTAMAASGTNKKLTAAYVVTTTGNAASVTGGGTIVLGGNNLTVGKTCAVAGEDTTNGFLEDQSFASLVNFGRTDATISGGTVTVTSSYTRVDTEGSAASDDLTTINGGTFGTMLVLQTVNSGRDVTVKHGTGNIYLRGATDFTLSGTRDKLFLICISSTNEWNEIGRGDNA